jgi:hypothetical protein
MASTTPEALGSFDVGPGSTQSSEIAALPRTIADTVGLIPGGALRFDYLAGCGRFC